MPTRQKTCFIKYFLKVIEGIDHDGTAKQYEKVLVKLDEFIGGKRKNEKYGDKWVIKSSIEFRQVDKHFCKKFKEYLQNELKDSSSYVYFSIFKAVINRALKDDIIIVNPTKSIANIKRKPKEVVYLDKEELKK